MKKKQSPKRPRAKGDLGKSKAPRRKPAARKPVPPVPPEKGRGPDEKYSVEQVAEALRAGRGLRTLAAAKLGCNRRTINRMIERHPELREVAAEEDEAQKDRAEGKLFEAIDKGEPWAICFFLKCRGKDRGYVERSEVSGPGGKGIPIDLSRLGEKDLVALERIMAKVAGGEE